MTRFPSNPLSVHEPLIIISHPWPSSRMEPAVNQKGTLMFSITLYERATWQETKISPTRVHSAWQLITYLRRFQNLNFYSVLIKLAWLPLLHKLWFCGSQVSPTLWELLDVWESRFLQIVLQFCGSQSHIVCQVSSICCSHTHAQPCECGSLDIDNPALSLLTSVITG
jgi:hypothetical protein